MPYRRRKLKLLRDKARRYSQLIFLKFNSRECFSFPWYYMVFYFCRPASTRCGLNLPGWHQEDLSISSKRSFDHLPLLDSPSSMPMTVSHIAANGATLLHESPACFPFLASVRNGLKLSFTHYLYFCRSNVVSKVSLAIPFSLMKNRLRNLWQNSEQ